MLNREFITIQLLVNQTFLSYFTKNNCLDDFALTITKSKNLITFCLGVPPNIYNASLGQGPGRLASPILTSATLPMCININQESDSIRK